MSETVRQMVVRMSMDAGGFKKSASDIRGQIRNLDKELKGMGSDVDPKLLTEKLSLQQAAITNLAAQVKQAETNFRNAKTEADKLAQAKRLSNLTTDLELAKKAAADTEKALARIDAMKWQNFGKTLTTLGGNLRRFGRQFSLLIGGPLAVLGGKAYKDALAYEQVMADIGIATETSGEELEALNNTVLKMTETIPMSYAELGALYATLARAGVPAGELERVTRVIAGLGATTDVSAEASAAAMIKFMNVMGIPLDQVENFASSLVALGNAGTSTGSEIFEMAQRMAATGNLAGLSAVEVLSLASSFSDMGINAEAGGTSAGKLIKAFQLAAETGKGLEDVVKDNGEVVMGFSTALGITGEEFQAAWNKDQVGLILRFFDALSAGAEKGDASVLAMLDAMDLTEVRLSNLIGVGASNPNFFRDMLGIGEKAWKDNTALADGVENAYGTAQAKQDIALNKMENASADVGENIVDILQPVITTVSNLVGEFGKLDEATQTRWVKVGAALVAIGPVSDAIGTAASGVGRIISFIGKVKPGEVTLFSRLVSALKGPAGGWLLVAAGLAGVVTAINSIKSPAEQVVEALQNIEISIDETSKNETLAAIRQVREEADALSGDRKTELEGATAAVESGYGTMGMFGESLEYARLLSEGEIKAASSSYREDLAELNRQFKEAKDAGDEELAGIIGQQITERTANYDAQVAAAKLAYTEQVGTLIDGMMKAQPEAKAALERAVQECGLYAMVASALDSNAGEMGEEAWNGLIENIRAGSEKLDFESGGVTTTMLLSLHDDLLASLNKNIGLVNEGELGFTLLNTLFGDPKNWEMLDVTQTKGTLGGMLGLMDLKGAAEKAGKDGETIGLYINQGIADGMNSAESGITDKPEEIKNKLVANLKAAFEMHSPSALMAREGVNISAGIAMGIDQGGAQVFAAMSALQEATVAQAAAMGAAVAAAYSAAFNANLNLNTPPGRTGSVSGLIREINQQNLRTLRGYGIG
jgi:TP901 family phage tail tape measure protein